MRKPCIIVGGYTYRINSEFECQISWRYSASMKKCHDKLRTDMDATTVSSGSLEHNHEPGNRTSERKVLIVCVKKEDC